MLTFNGMEQVRGLNRGPRFDPVWLLFPFQLHFFLDSILLTGCVGPAFFYVFVLTASSYTCLPVLKLPVPMRFCQVPRDSS